MASFILKVIPIYTVTFTQVTSRVIKAFSAISTRIASLAKIGALYAVLIAAVRPIAFIALTSIATCV
jgi:hypothetical protein